MSTTEDRQLRARVDKLREELNYHAKKYYVEDAPEISDYEYDRLFYELVHIEQEHPDLDDPASPTASAAKPPTALKRSRTAFAWIR